MTVEIQCDKLHQAYDSLGTAAQRIENTMTPLFSTLKGLIGAQTEQTQGTIDTIVSNVEGYTPPTPDIATASEVSLFKCLFPDFTSQIDDVFNGVISISAAPVELIGEAVKKAAKAAESAVSVLLDTNVIGLLGQEIDKFNKMLANSGLVDLLSSLDSFYVCLVAHCSSYYPTPTTYATDIRTSLGIDSNGVVDLNTAAWGSLTTTYQSQLNSLTGAVATSMDTTNTTVLSVIPSNFDGAADVINIKPGTIATEAKKVIPKVPGMPAISLL